MEDNKTASAIKVTSTDHCIECDQELKTMKLNGGDLFNFTPTTGAFYCENKDCKFFGYLTVGRRVKTEKKETK